MVLAGGSKPVKLQSRGCTYLRVGETSILQNLKLQTHKLSAQSNVRCEEREGERGEESECFFVALVVAGVVADAVPVGSLQKAGAVRLVGSVVSQCHLEDLARAG